MPETCECPFIDTYSLKSGEKMSFERHGLVRIDVTDSGAGLSLDQVSALFKDGVQFNVNELQSGQGSGLGLYISKGIVKQHGGDLQVRSEGLGRGSTFTFTLPLYLDQDSSSNSSPSQLALSSDSSFDSTVSEQSLLKVLVVDDIASNRKLLSRLVAKLGHDVHQAQNGEEAVDLVKTALDESSPYDSILMDYEMPVLNGPDASKKIRSLGCDSYIIGVTGNVMAEDVGHFIACGANTICHKPVDIRKIEDLWVEHGLIDHVTTSVGPNR